jgi:hypothetical protein
MAEMNQQIELNGLGQTTENREFILNLVSKVGMNAKIKATFV